MSHHEANKIRRKLVPFMTLLLAVACMGLLASCSVGGNNTTNSDLSNIPTNTFDRPLTAENIIVSERTGFAMVKGEVIATLEDQNQLESFKNRLNPEWQILSHDRGTVVIQTYAADENKLMENIAIISAMTGVLAAIENQVYTR